MLSIDVFSREGQTLNEAYRLRAVKSVLQANVTFRGNRYVSGRKNKNFEHYILQRCEEELKAKLSRWVCNIFAQSSAEIYMTDYLSLYNKYTLNTKNILSAFLKGEKIVISSVY